MNKLSLLFCILCAVCVPQMATASDHDLETALNQQFKDKILVLRHPDGHESLRYDADGKPLNGGREGAWTIYGAVMIQKVELTGSKLHLQGRRLYVRRAASGLSTFEFQRARANENPPVSSSVRVEISTDQPVTTVEQAQ